MKELKNGDILVSDINVIDYQIVKEIKGEYYITDRDLQINKETLIGFDCYCQHYHLANEEEVKIIYKFNKIRYIFGFCDLLDRITKTIKTLEELNSSDVIFKGNELQEAKLRDDINTILEAIKSKLNLME